MQKLVVGLLLACAFSVQAKTVYVSPAGTGTGEDWRSATSIQAVADVTSPAIDKGDPEKGVATVRGEVASAGRRLAQEGRGRFGILHSTPLHVAHFHSTIHSLKLETNS